MIDAGIENAPLCLPPLPMQRAPLAQLPAGTVDTHFHVFGAGAPLASPRSYTPQVATLADWVRLADKSGVARGVIVQPSVYGFDNSVLLEAIAGAAGRLRGISVVPPQSRPDELESLHALGIRGVRCNTQNLGGMGFEAALDLAARIAPFDWTLQFLVRWEQLETLVELAPRLAVRIVIDHLGFIDPGRGPAALRPLRALLDAGRTYVKLSAPYRLSSAAGYADYVALAAELVRTHPERLLWGSDWPHPGLWAAMPDDAELVDMGLALAGDAATARTIFADTPNALFFAD